MEKILRLLTVLTSHRPKIITIVMLIGFSWAIDRQVYYVLKSIPYTTTQLRSVGIEVLPLEPFGAWVRGIITFLLVPIVCYAISVIITTYWLPHIVPPPPEKKDAWQPLSLLATLANSQRLIRISDGDIYHVTQAEVYKIEEKRNITNTQYNEKEARVTDLNWYVIMTDRLQHVGDPLPTIVDNSPSPTQKITFSL